MCLSNEGLDVYLCHLSTQNINFIIFLIHIVVPALKKSDELLVFAVTRFKFWFTIFFI